MNGKKTICEIEGKHGLGICTYSNGYVIQIQCPRCGAFAILTETDLENAIIETLTREGRYTDIERIQ